MSENQSSEESVLDPLQRVLRAEAEARDAIARAGERGEAAVVAARIEARRIRERGEQRTRQAIERAEQRSVERTIAEIQRQDRRAERDLDLDAAELERRLQELALLGVDRIWPQPK